MRPPAFALSRQPTTIRAGIQIVHDLVSGSITRMNSYVVENAASIAATLSRKVDVDGNILAPGVMGATTLGDELKAVGFDTNPNRPLSLNEIIIFLTLMDRQNLLRDMQMDDTQVGSMLGALPGELRKSLSRVREDVAAAKREPEGGVGPRLCADESYRPYPEESLALYGHRY